MTTFIFSSHKSFNKSLFKRLISITALTFSLLSQGLSAQGAQALDAEELKKINQQPISKTVKNNAESGKAESKKPTFEHTESDGTHIKEFKESGKPTEVVVESAFGTYEMTAPNDSTNPKREQEMIRVPTIRMPF
jgi:cytoskeletal protein RodZ